MRLAERPVKANTSDDDPRFAQIIGNSPALEPVLTLVERVAPTDSTVLIQGETAAAKS